ncbi:MAG: hypothetical protein LVR00_07180 [Rhabdochlamydiaceae bacterium]
MLDFSKYEAAGNDFILIDDRALLFPAQDFQMIAKLCHRRFGIGADGLILLQPSKKGDFLFRIFNSDGKEAAMCGNGIRCLVHFIYTLGFNQPLYSIETQHSLLSCQLIDGKVSSFLSVQSSLNCRLKWGRMRCILSIQVCLMLSSLSMIWISLIFIIKQERSVFTPFFNLKGQMLTSFP